MSIFNRYWKNPETGILDHNLLLTRGPALEVEIGVTKAHVNALVVTNKPIPNSHNGTALIDTGAAFTAVDESILDGLGLNPVNTVPIIGPTGNEEQGVYFCQIKFLGTDIPALEQWVIGSKLSKFGHAALIGRNLLNGCLLVYDGKHAQWTLAV